MTYELDGAVRDLTERLRKLELSVARNRPASGIGVGDSGALFGVPGSLTLEEVLELLGSAAVPGVWYKEPVDAATTANITLFSDLDPGDVIDGVTLVDQDRVLVKNQSDPSENGIYVVGSDVRSTDMDASTEVLGAAVYVTQGTTNGGTLWINTNTTPPVIDTDAITFAQFNTASGSLGTITDGITTVAPVTSLTVEPHSLSGTTPNASHALNRLVTVADAGAAYEFDLADGNVFDLTLTEDCDLTIAAGAVSGYPETLVVILRQDGTGGWVVSSWDAAVTWQDTDGTTGGPAPTLFTAAGAVDTILLTSFDGGTTWGGYHSSGSGAAAIEILDDGASLTATPTSMDFVGAGVTATAVGDDVTVTIPGVSGTGAVGAILITDTPAGSPLVFADLLQNDAGTDLLYADL